jgi:hypothetical protein
MSCGCKQYDEDHGDPRNLTMNDFKDAAEAAGSDVQQVAKNIAEGFQNSGSGTRSGEYAGSAAGQTSRGSGGFDDAHRGGEQTATEQTMTGAQGRQYETGREGDLEQTGTATPGNRGQTGNR